MTRTPTSACLLAIALSGCGTELATLKGTVFVDGKPAPAGIALAFDPLADEGSPSYATTDHAGRYEAAFTFRKMGILPGQHRVHLIPGGEGGSAAMPPIGPDGQPVSSERPVPPVFPREYFQEITTITVEPGANQIDLQLTPADN